jgi:hypothetical protein
MIMKMKWIALLSFMVLTAGSAHAAENTAQTRLDNKTKTLMEKMDENQLRQLASIRTAHGTIRAVENVQDSVKKAVTACVAKNPDLQDRMTSRFDNWKLAIRPTLKKAQSRLEKMILLQSFGKPSEVRSYLKLFDEAVAARDAAIKSVPITEKAECERLIRKMDETEENLTKLLTESLSLDQPIMQKDL